MSLISILRLLIGCSFLLSGLVAWRCRPGNRIGPLMVAFGAAHLVADELVNVHAPVAITVGILFQDGAGILYVLMLLAFPSGRLSSRRDWLILGPVVVALVPLELAWLLFFQPEGAPAPNALVFWPSEDTAYAIDLAQRLLLAGAELALAAILARRWLTASTPRRRMLAPALAGAVAILVLTGDLLYEKFVGQPPTAFLWLVLAAFVAVPIALLATLLRARLARSAVGELVIGLRAGQPPAELREALARALGDASLDLAYWLPEFDIYVDVEGRPVELPPAGAGRATTRVEYGGREVAVLVHDPSLEQEPARLAEVSAAAGIALENAQLHAELRARLEELRGSRIRVIEATDTARRRLERDLHDGAQKRLVAISMELGRLDARVGSDPGARELLDNARREVGESLRELREIARGIHPAVLTGHGLGVALESLAVGAPVPVRLDVRLPGRVSETAEVAAYYLVCESLANIAKHAHASAASVEVRRLDGRIVIEVSDDGVGGADTAGGSGLRGLADRVEALDGSLQVWSPHGAGTRVRAEIPCA